MFSFFSKLLAPSTALLNRLNFTLKFALIFGLYVIPVGYVLFISLVEHTKGVDQAKRERKGVQYGKPASSF